MACHCCTQGLVCNWICIRKAPTLIRLNKSIFQEVANQSRYHPLAMNSIRMKTPTVILVCFSWETSTTPVKLGCSTVVQKYLFNENFEWAKYVIIRCIAMGLMRSCYDRGASQSTPLLIFTGVSFYCSAGFRSNSFVINSVIVINLYKKWMSDLGDKCIASYPYEAQFELLSPIVKILGIFCRFLCDPNNEVNSCVLGRCPNLTALRRETWPEGACLQDQLYRTAHQKRGELRKRFVVGSQHIW